MKKATPSNTHIGDIVTNVISLIPRYQPGVKYRPGNIFEVTSIPAKVRIVKSPNNDGQDYFINMKNMFDNSEFATDFCNLRLLLTQSERDTLILNELEERNK